MKKFLLTLAAVALAASAMMAQTNVTTTTVEEPDRVQMKELSKNPTGRDVATGNMPQQQVKHECKDHKDGKPCTKPADQQCPDCKAKAEKQECKEGMKDCKKAEGMKCEKAEGMKCEKAEGKKCEKAEGKKCEKAEGMKHECKEGKHECKEGKHECKEGKHECKEGKRPEGMKLENRKANKLQKVEKVEGKKAEAKKCEKVEGMKHECKDGKACDKPADQQCPDCKDKAKKD